MMVILVAVCTRVGCWGWSGGYTYCVWGGLKDPSIVRMRGELYLSIILMMSLSAKVSEPVVRGCVVVIEESRRRISLRNAVMY